MRLFEARTHVDQVEIGHANDVLSVQPYEGKKRVFAVVSKPSLVSVVLDIRAVFQRANRRLQSMASISSLPMSLHRWGRRPNNSCV